MNKLTENLLDLGLTSHYPAGFLYIRQPGHYPYFGFVVALSDATHAQQHRNGTAMPKISVGMPVYNGERYVDESIRSVLAQTFEDFEFLIADNGSTDRTAEICQDWASKDPRIVFWRNQDNIGAAGNYNALFSKASAPYFRWSNADDLLEPTLHEKCLQALEDNPQAVLAAGKTIFIDSDGKRTQEFDDNLHITDLSASTRLREFMRRVSLTNVIYGLMRTEALARTDLMGDGTIPAFDTILMGQLVLHGHYLQVPEPLFYRRMHEASSSSDRGDENLQQAFWSAGQSKFKRPCSRKIMAYLRGISNARLTASEAFGLYKLMSEQIWAHKSIILAEIVRPNRAPT